ncbi:transmembrane protease serine 11B-like [Trichosurus vulpecula]|uniref:transmembrane protease serine 11B-like n=1 Tax=Trichosurus vulpecula TaxID=9337 RepID=UPI00186B231F|nr:transmembrane protease serine 11B-like [Trichosurus vulpecula]
MITLILFGILVVLGVIIGLLVHFLATERTHYYQGSFHISGVSDSYDCGKRASQKSKALIEKIENLISDTFYNSSISREYISSQVIQLPAETNGVMAKIWLAFKFVLAKRDGMRRKIQNILHQMLKDNKTSLTTDPSSLKIMEISEEDAEKLVINCCGRRLRLLSDDLIIGNNRIIGGKPSKEGEWPWQASLKLNGQHECGASLISNKWLVSAAHCFARRNDTKKWTVAFGNVVNRPYMERNVKTIILHEDYRSPLIHDDIALVELAKEVTFTNNIRAICLPEATQNFSAGEMAVVTGWGTLSMHGPLPLILQQATVQIIDTDTCNASGAYSGSIKNSMLCAGYMSGKIDACQNDSGGPLASLSSRGVWYLIGIVSWGEGCGKVNKPGVYTRLTFYRDWITKKTGI